MENKHKQFNAFDKVLVREGKKWPWRATFYSHYNPITYHHYTTSGAPINEILPYEGNEHLVGTTDEPEEVIELKHGEWIMCFLHISVLPFGTCLRKFESTKEEEIKAYDGRWSSVWPYCIKLSDFNSNGMEEIKKHILCVKNGKIVKYKE